MGMRGVGYGCIMGGKKGIRGNQGVFERDASIATDSSQWNEDRDGR